MRRILVKHPLRSSPCIRGHLVRPPEVRVARIVQAAADSKHTLGVPVTLQMSDLPPDGETLTDFELTCDPEERTCKTPRHVYEEVCPSCYGTGKAVSMASRARKGKGKRQMGACVRCGGVGYLRHVTSRYQPEVNGSLQGPTSLFRPRSENGTGPTATNGNGAKPPSKNGTGRNSETGA